MISVSLVVPYLAHLTHKLNVELENVDFDSDEGKINVL